MSDTEPEINVPKAAVHKIIDKIASSKGVYFTRDTRGLIGECCSEFVQLLSFEANEVCESKKRKTISPAHLLEAMDILGFERIKSEVEKEYKRVKEDENSKSSSKRQRRKQNDALYTEDNERTQAMLFSKAMGGPEEMHSADE